MKKAFAILTALWLVGLCAACGTSRSPDIDLDNITEINVTHRIGGTEEKMEIIKRDSINKITEWFNALSLKLQKFHEGNSPGDLNSGEVYSFEIENNSFAYIVNGQTECYILYGREWYKVNNPSMPPIER